MNITYILVKYQKSNKRASTEVELGWVVRMKRDIRYI